MVMTVLWVCWSEGLDRMDRMKDGVFFLTTEVTDGEDCSMGLWKAKGLFASFAGLVGFTLVFFTVRTAFLLLGCF